MRTLSKTFAEALKENFPHTNPNITMWESFYELKHYYNEAVCYIIKLRLIVKI